MGFWRNAGKSPHDTAESGTCFKEVYDTLKVHIDLVHNYEDVKAQWDDRVNKSNNKAQIAKLRKEMPVKPTSATLKIKIKDLLQNFPYMSQYPHLFKNTLQVNTVLLMSEIILPAPWSYNAQYLPSFRAGCG